MVSTKTLLLKHYYRRQGSLQTTTSMTIVVTVVKGDVRDKVHQKKEDTTTTCIPLRHLCCDFLLHLLSYGVMVGVSNSRSSNYIITVARGGRKRVHHTESTSGEETTTSSSPHLGSQCSYNVGALQHHDRHYNRCTSCDDVRDKDDILATCLHLYDVDIKDGTCYIFNFPQPRLPTPTVFDGTAPTFPEWARELRAYLNISQLSTSTSWTSPKMRRHLLQQISWSCKRK